MANFYGNWPIRRHTDLEEVKHRREGRPLEKRGLGELEHVGEAGAGHVRQTTALESGDGGEEVESELRNVEVGLREERRQLDEHRLKVPGIEVLVVVADLSKFVIVKKVDRCSFKLHDCFNRPPLPMCRREAAWRV